MLKTIFANTLLEDLLNDMVSDLKEMLRSRSIISQELNNTKSTLVGILLEDQEKIETEKCLRIVRIKIFLFASDSSASEFYTWAVRHRIPAFLSN
jgi:hypothetical protein